MSVVYLEPSVQNVLTSTSETEAVQRVDGNKEMGKDAFLKLLMAQIQNQDPLNPMDGVEFTAQLAQFTSLEQLYNINSNFTGLNTALQAQYNFQAIDLVGKEVRAAGDNLSVQDGQSTGGHFTLADTAASVKVYLYQEDGSLVQTVDLGALNAGEHDFTWDGQTWQGKQAADGNYTFEVVALDSNYLPIEVTQEMKGRVTGVTLSQTDGATLLLGGLKVKMEDLIEIVEPTATE
ncbi:MAG: flagellar hook capping FlgD N-terminal domain-containing protein [Thermodesulfobacteriota bacterium]